MEVKYLGDEPDKPAGTGLVKFLGDEPLPDQSAQTGLGATQQQRLQQRFRGTTQERIAEISGHEKDIDYRTGAPFSIMVDLESADNPDEAKAIMALRFGEGNFGQDKGGRWWFKDPKTGKKTAVSPSFLSGVVATSPETIGAIGGGILGSVGGPLGIVGGAAAGGTIGKGVKEIDKYLQGVLRKSPGEEALTLGKEAAIQGGLSAIPAVGGPIVRKAGEALRTFGLGVTPQTSARTGVLLAQGAIPPVTSVAPEATGLGKKQDIAARVSHGGRFGAHDVNIGVVQEELRKQMRRVGMSETEIADFMQNIATKQEAVSTAETGRSIVGAAQERVATSQATIDAELAQARGAMERNLNQIQRYASRRPGDLGQSVADAITDARSDFGRRMTEAYSQVHALAGGEGTVEMRPAIEAAQQIMSEMAGNPNAVPATIRRLAAGERSIPVGEPPRPPEPGQPPAGPRPREWQEFESLEVAHNLRNDLRADARQRSLTLTPDQQYAMISRVEDALDGAITDLARSGRGLPAEAARELARVDAAYREGIARFKNAAARRLVADARDGIFADPSTIARTIMQPGQTDQARELLRFLPNDVREGVGQAYLGNILERVSAVDPFTGRRVINGRALLDFLGNEQNANLNRLVFSRQFQNDLRQLATEYAALNGEVELSAVTPSTVRDMLARANARARELDAYVKSDPVGKLASDDPTVVDRAVRAVSTPKDEQATVNAYQSLSANPGAWERVQQDNLRLMFSDLFQKGEGGKLMISGKPIRDRMASYTQRQRDLLFPNGMGDDILDLAENINFLFPQSLVGGGTRMQSGLAAGAIQARGFFSPIALPKRIYYYAWDWLLRRPATLRFLANQSRSSPNKEYLKAVLGAQGRMIFNELRAGPTEGAPTPPPEKRASINPDEGRVVSDIDERPIAGQQYAMMNEDDLRNPGQRRPLATPIFGGPGAPPSKPAGQLPPVEPRPTLNYQSAGASRGTSPTAKPAGAEKPQPTSSGGITRLSDKPYKGEKASDIAARSKESGTLDYRSAGAGSANENKLSPSSHQRPIPEEYLQPKTFMQRIFDNTKNMNRDEILQSEPIWGGARQLAESGKMSFKDAFHLLVEQRTGYGLTSQEWTKIAEQAMQYGIR